MLLSPFSTTEIAFSHTFYSDCSFRDVPALSSVSKRSYVLGVLVIVPYIWLQEKEESCTVCTYRVCASFVCVYGAIMVYYIYVFVFVCMCVCLWCDYCLLYIGVCVCVYVCVCIA